MIINRQTWCITSDTQGIHNSIRSHQPSYLADDDDDADYILIEFKDAEDFKTTAIHTLIAPRLLERIQNPTDNLHLLLSNTHEAFHSCVEPIYNFVLNRYGIPEHKCVLYSNSFDIVKEVEYVANNYQMKQIKVKLIMVFEQAAKEQLKYLLRTDQNYTETLVNKEYNKAYLNLNRRWRLHRPVLVAMLAAKGLLDDGHISLAPADDDKCWDTPSLWDSIETVIGRYPVIDNILTPNKTFIKNLPFMYLDTTDLKTNRAEITDTKLNKFYTDTYFSVISETNYFKDFKGFETGRFLSEKTFKAIAYRHPFIVVSVPKILVSMRSIGYKTFSPYIDESYDLIDNDGDRLAAIADEIARLSNLEGTELTHFLNGAREITNYNYNVFIKKQKYIHRLN